MKFKNCKCSKCNCNNVYKKENQTHIGLYCKNCDSWIKWITKDESKLFDILLKEKKNNKNIKSKKINIQNNKAIVENNETIIKYLHLQLDDVVNQNCISQTEMFIKSAKIQIIYNTIEFINDINKKYNNKK